jgi:DNA-binding transcriptional MerR regulator
MYDDRMTIGEVSKRAGLPVKTIRFYSDEGLFPPSERTEAGYRLYTEGDLVRLDLIRTLRDAGLDLSTIGAVLRREMDLADALQLRLRALESHIVSLQNVAAAIRAALRSGPEEDDLRRLHAVTRLSNEERKAVIERFYAEVSEGIPMDQEWVGRMIEASAPKMPDEPTKEQLDAWIELSEIVSDRGFVENMRRMSAQTWTDDFDHRAYQEATQETASAARKAIDKGLAPESSQAAAIVERLVEGTAASKGKAVDDELRASVHESFAQHDPRASRYWVLVATINGQPTMGGPTEEWDWIARAVVAHLRPR